MDNDIKQIIAGQVLGSLTINEAFDLVYRAFDLDEYEDEDVAERGAAKYVATLRSFIKDSSLLR